MREILFRGKRKDNGEWVQGSLFAEGSRVEIVRGTCNNVGIEGVDVIPETVGQYTGLTANGKKIFEGDVVKFKNTDGINFNGTPLTVIGKVVYNEKTASFAVYGKDEIGAKHCDYFPIKNIEIIGNLHDNPELLGDK